jgi:hypothetical protein
MKTPIDYDNALASMTNRLQNAFYAILAIHRDESYLNPDHPLMKKARKEFEEADAAIFRFKQAWHEIQNAMNKESKGE